MEQLTVWQRVRRGITRSYPRAEGPDGGPIAATSGADDNPDSDEAKIAKAAQKWRKETRVYRLAGACWVGLGVYTLFRPGAPIWQLLLGGFIIAAGLVQVGY